jgi:hypothetical protein
MFSLGFVKIDSFSTQCKGQGFFSECAYNQVFEEFRLQKKKKGPIPIDAK